MVIEGSSMLSDEVSSLYTYLKTISGHNNGTDHSYLLMLHHVLFPSCSIHIGMRLPTLSHILCLVCNLLCICAGSPNPLDGLGQTNIVRLELIPSPAHDEDCEDVTPLEELTNVLHAPRGDVVDDDGSGGAD